MVRLISTYFCFTFYWNSSYWLQKENWENGRSDVSLKSHNTMSKNGWSEKTHLISNIFFCLFLGLPEIVQSTGEGLAMVMIRWYPVAWLLSWLEQLKGWRLSKGHWRGRPGGRDYGKDHPYTTSAKDSLGGFKKWQFLMTFSTIFMLTRWL